jgi:uncharacterized protein (TIGR00255 family)
MIRSMTGFARAEAQGPWGRLAWELRAVNHRYLDVSLRLPEELRAIEGEVRTRAAARLSRGKLEAGLRFSQEGAEASPIVIDTDRLKQLRRALDTATVELGATTPPDPVRVLAWPGIVKGETRDAALVQAAALKLLEQTLTEFSRAREQEGARLAKYLRDHCDALEAQVAEVRRRLPEVRTQWAEKLRQRCRDLGVEVEPSRLEQEVVLAAQRLDVDEELSRLGSHLVAVREAIARDDAVGRKLDFLMQELNREANTLASKSQDADVTRRAVDIKVIIEQMREQVQNIE